MVTQYAMEDIEELGLLKMDFLGLRTLTVLHNTLRFIRDSHRMEMTLEDIPLDDAQDLSVAERSPHVRRLSA